MSGIHFISVPFAERRRAAGFLSLVVGMSTGLYFIAVLFTGRRRAAGYSSLVVGMSSGLYVIVCYVCRVKESSQLIISFRIGMSA